MVVSTDESCENVAVSAPSRISSEDPLVAALPPATDYITYLTILEYQLTPENLATLNRLLAEDDGTLVSEIGWDLLKLVLPMLSVAVPPVEECLDIIAKRGNPREVIVRVAEELEKLGRHDEDVEYDALLDNDDGLPTFAGEAPRVHLGYMTLDGMPELESRVNQPLPQSTEETPALPEDDLSFDALLRMLPPLHARIKTQFPSRFLATSLPAALGAYRRSSMRSHSTLMFLETLRGIGTRSRPALPPRIPSVNEANPVSTAHTRPQSQSNGAQSTAESLDEQAIVTRLLQAVLLEIIDESIASSLSSETPSAQLVMQLRIKHAARTVPSYRQAELVETLKTEAYQSTIQTYRTFLDTANALKLDVSAQIEKSSNPAPDADDAESEQEYPTSPSQIPFSSSGLLLLWSIQQCLTATISTDFQNMSPIDPVSIPALLEIATVENESLFACPTAADLILGLVFLHFVSDASPALHSTPQSAIQTLLSILQHIFTSNSEPSIRDNAHYIATHIFHSLASRTTKVDIVKDMLRTPRPSSSTSPQFSLFELQSSANLRTVAINWLKDEIYPSELTKHMMQAASGTEHQAGLPEKTILDLASQLFPCEHLLTGQATTDLDDFAASIPLYIASCNLFCLVAQTQSPQLANDTNAIANTTTIAATSLTNTDRQALRQKVEAFLKLPNHWRSVLLDKVHKTGASGDDGLDASGLSLTDIFALDDALNRTHTAMVKIV